MVLCGSWEEFLLALVKMMLLCHWPEWNCPHSALKHCIFRAWLLQASHLYVDRLVFISPSGRIGTRLRKPTKISLSLESLRKYPERHVAPGRKREEGRGGLIWGFGGEQMQKKEEEVARERTLWQITKQGRPRCAGASTSFPILPT